MLAHKQLNKMALFTDYHVGKQRTPFYTTITTEFMDWFVAEVQADSTIDCIGFLGDWHEFQNSIYIDTLKLSHTLISKLNSIGLPIIFVVGNHDLFNRRSRDTHSCVFFDQFSNITVVDQPIILPQFDGGALFSPYLFHSEYSQSLLKTNSAHLLGHFEFKDFILTGQTVKMEHGPDCTEFSEYKTILSGHFHKRQRQRNVQFIGNTFCTSFADAGDIDRGMCVYQFDTATTSFKNWSGSPRYVSTTLSAIKTGSVTNTFTDRTFVKCVADVTITYEESVEFKRGLIADYGLRDVNISQDVEVIKDAIDNTQIDGSTPSSLTTNELISHMISQIQVDKIDNKLLSQLYSTL